jgi:GTPase
MECIPGVFFMTDDFNKNISDKDPLATPPGFKSGFVAILGKPNAGKSTLLNHILGRKLTIVSRKPQTTRDTILGIFSREKYQIVFVDTPGIIEANNLLNRCLIDAASMAIEDVDLIYHILDVNDPEPVTPAVAELIRSSKAPKFLLANKTDRLSKPFKPKNCPNLPDIKDYNEVLGISALNGDNISWLMKKTLDLLPEGPLYYDPEQVSDRNMRFLCAEIVREKTFELLGQELPYSIAVQIEEFKERDNGKHYVRAVIYVERDSQKGMIIGSGGKMLKEIGSLARPDMEKLVESSVYLDLWVKVRKNWTKKENELRFFGYFPKKRKKSLN